MKIAIIGSVLYKAPFEKGLIHAPIKITYDLAYKLSQLGHDVTFFGLLNKKRNKNISLKNISFDYPYSIKYDKKPINFLITYEQGFIEKVLKLEKEFDIFYTHVYKVGPLAGLIKKPVVFTHHDSTRLETYNLMFESFHSKNLFIIPPSKWLKSKINDKNCLNAIHNGTDISNLTTIRKKDFFCWIGRVVPAKGIHIAIKLAKEMGFSLKIAGPMGNFTDFKEQNNFNKSIKLQIKKNKNIEYLGILNQKETYKLMAQSIGLIYPSNGNEAFGMILIESMMSGTPAVTFNNGPFPEIIDQGKTGYLCDNLNAMKKAIKNINKIDSQLCREQAIKQFSLDVMAKKYERQFKKTIKTKNA